MNKKDMVEEIRKNNERYYRNFSISMAISIVICTVTYILIFMGL